MKLLDIQTVIGAAVVVLSLPCDAKHGRGMSHPDTFGKRHHHKRIHLSPKVEGIEDGLQKRGSCQFPSDAGLVAVTPGSSNAGWAMSPDQCCTPGTYCPYACPSGQVMAQWDPSATSYTYPQSMVRVQPRT
jgi:Beta-glucosidase (SUN family)